VVGVAGLRPAVVAGGDLLLLGAPAVKPGSAELSLSVAPGWRRRGIGSRLLATVREEAAGPCLVADVTDGSPGEAFCLRHGFRRIRSWRRELLGLGDVHGAWLREP
jgi:GNAT superfamily N-acetyltransferase